LSYGGLSDKAKKRGEPLETGLFSQRFVCFDSFLTEPMN